MTADNKTYFKELNSIDVSDKIEKKNGLSYLSWAFAWGELKKRYPDSSYTIYENAQGWNYHTDGKTAWVKTGVTVCGLEHIEYLPIMDYRNNSIPLEKITSFDVNKAIQRSLTKAVARHGLGLFVYAGEDLPETSDKTETPAPAKRAPVKAKPVTIAPAPVKIENVREELVNYCKENGIRINDIAKDYHLNNNSTDEEFKKALDYCKFTVDMRQAKEKEEG